MSERISGRVHWCNQAVSLLGWPSTLREYPACFRYNFVMSVAFMLTASSVPYKIPARIAFFQMVHLFLTGRFGDVMF
jgi:hypothetical protein